MIEQGIIVPHSPNKTSEKRQSAGKNDQQGRNPCRKASRNEKLEKMNADFSFFPIPDAHSKISSRLYWLAKASEYLRRKRDDQIVLGWRRVAHSVKAHFNRYSQAKGVSEEYALACARVCEILQAPEGYMKEGVSKFFHEMIKFHESELERLSKSARKSNKKSKKLSHDHYKSSEYSVTGIWIRGKAGFSRWGR